MNIDHLSPSSLDMLCRCGEQFRRRYVMGEIIPPGFAMIRGSGTHKSIEANLTAKVMDGAMLPIEQCQDIARDHVKSVNKGEVVLEGKEKSAGFEKTQSQAIDMAVGGAAIHRVLAAPQLEPVKIESETGTIVGIERRYEVTYETGWPWKSLLGYLDIEEAHDLRDEKTAKRVPNASKAEESRQLVFYAVLYKEFHGFYPENGMFLDTMVLNATMLKSVPDIIEGKPLKAKKNYRGFMETPKPIVVQPTDMTEDKEGVFWNTLERVAECIEKEVFLPCDRMHWVCQPAMCGYYNSCPVRTRGR